MSTQDNRGGLVPFADAPILSTLPKQGTVVGKFKPLALQVHAIKDRLGGEFTSDELNGRLRTLALHGLVVTVKVLPAGRGLGYQITPEGERWLADNKEVLSQ